MSPEVFSRSKSYYFKVYFLLMSSTLLNIETRDYNLLDNSKGDAPADEPTETDHLGSAGRFSIFNFTVVVFASFSVCHKLNTYKGRAV